MASGDIRPLAVASAERALSQPDVPTLRELGWDVVADNQKGWVGPAGLTDEMVSFYHDRCRQGMNTLPWRRVLDRLGEADGYADGPGFQRAIDTLLDDVRAALRRS